MFSKMRIRFLLTVLMALIIAVAASPSVLAGGWVVITLDELPENVIAGQPYSVGMMARQHGRMPWEVEELVIEAKQAETGKVVTFAAKPDQKPGHYQVELLFPEPGRWEWGIGSGMHPPSQPMPALDVAADSQSGAFVAAQPTQRSVLFPEIPQPVLGVFALLTFTAGVFMIVRSGKRRFPLLAGIGLIILCGGFAFALFSSANAETAEEQVLPASQTVSDEITGQKLFLAKGCVVCHTNNRAIRGSSEYGVNFGPNLTSYRNDPAFLHQFLKDPQSVNAASEMPNLELKLVEIEALIAFINDHE